MMFGYSFGLPKRRGLADQIAGFGAQPDQAARIAFLRHDAAGAGFRAFDQQDPGFGLGILRGDVGDQRAERQRARGRKSCDFGAAVDRRNLVGIE